jgi:hypothetical protein
MATAAEKKAAEEAKEAEAAAEKAAADKAAADKKAAKVTDPHKEGATHRVKASHKSPVQIHVPGASIAGSLIIPGNCLPKDTDKKVVDGLVKRGIVEAIK